MANVREWMGSRWWWVVAALAVFSVVVTAAQSTSALTGGRGRPPTCTTAQIRLHVGPNRHVAGGRVETAVLTLTNVGPTCTLENDAPVVQPVVGTPPRAVGRASVLDTLHRAAVVLARGHSARSAISVAALPPVLERTCRPVRVDGLVVSYGAPPGTSRYVRHALTGVCSNRVRDNVGTQWYASA